VIDLQTVLTYLTLISVPIGVFYHILTLYNTRKNQQLQLETRQAQLFMNLFQTYRSPEFVEIMDHVIYRLDIEDWDDAVEKIHPVLNPEMRVRWFSVGTFFEGLGVLVRRGLIDISLVDDSLGNTIKMLWEKMGPVETESRKRFEIPRLFDDFEYLYNEILRYEGISSGTTLISMEKIKQQLEQETSSNP